MRFGAMPGQRVLDPATGAQGSSSAPNFINYQPSGGSVSNAGVGSNQYGNLPPWMAVGGAMGSGGSPQMANVPGGSLGPAMSGSQPYGGIAGGSSGAFGGPMAYGASAAGGGYGVPPQSLGTQTGGLPGWTGAGGGPVLGGGNWSIEQTMFPQLTQALGNELLGQVGQGVSPFNLSTQLPFGGTTQPGQLTAQANPLLQSLMSAYQGGQTNIPGFSALSQIANQGISALPEWQSMIQAQGQNIAQTQGNLQEQLGQTGNLAGTPYGNTMANFGAQTAAQQNALLGQLQQQNILQGQIPVAETLMGGAQQMGQYGQALNQQAIQNMLNEFIRTSPQYNPLLQAQYGMATSWDPALNRTTGGGLISGILGSLPNISYNPSTGGVTF